MAHVKENFELNVPCPEHLIAQRSPTMTPNLELLKKIQPLFTEWNVGDRGINKGGTFIYIEEENSLPKLPSDGHRVVFVGGRCNAIIPYSKWCNVLHYPYLHQMWDKVDWSNFTIRYVHPNTTNVTLTARNYIKNDWSVIADLETALLKALIWQMEQEEK